MCIVVWTKLIFKETVINSFEVTIFFNLLIQIEFVISHSETLLNVFSKICNHKYDDSKTVIMK